MSETLLIEIFDLVPPSPEALEGPLPDPDLVVLEQELARLRRELGERVRVRWHARGANPEAYQDRPAVAGLVRERGAAVLPITAVNGRVIKTGSYPCYQEIAVTEEAVLAAMGWE